jgi:peptidoglycan/LPS O-acetylase OafA/YrhL
MGTVGLAGGSPARVMDQAGTAPGDRRFRPDVEGLRAVAVLLVVLYHANLPGLHGGFVGVDVFFVISGFVITGLLLRERSSTGRTSLLSFYSRRVRRILPAATLVIVTTVVTAYAVLGVVYGNPTAIAARWTAVFLANVHFASIGTNYLTANQPPSPLQNFWSLAVEEQFYLVYPAIVLLVASFRSTVSLRVRLGLVLIPIIVASLVLSAVQTTTDPTAAFFSPFTRAWELALGALVAVATPALLRLPHTVAAALTWVGMVAIGFSAIVYNASSPYPGTLVMVPVIGSALVIAGGTPVPVAGVEALLRLRPFQWLGRLSYSLYLWHWPILIIAAEAAGLDSLPFHRNLGWLGLSLLASYVTFRLVENPVRHSRALGSRRRMTMGMGAVLVALSLTVATVDLSVHATAAAGRGASALPNVPSLTPAQLAALVAAAPRITKLPPNLQPSLSAVRGDWGGPMGACWPAGGRASVPACVFGDRTGAHTMVLYGDSHAAMWSSIMSFIALLSHWRLVILTKGGCPFVDLPFRNPTGYRGTGAVFTACDKWHTFAVARIKAIHPDLVVVTQDPNLGPGNKAYSDAQWEKATADALRQMPVAADRVVVLGDIPQTTLSGPTCLSLHPTDVQRCSAPDSGYIAGHNDAEQRAAATTGARYIDVVPWFCSTICTGVVGNYQPYWDPFHINRTYSYLVGRVLSESIDLNAYASADTSPAPPPAPLAPASPG